MSAAKAYMKWCIKACDEFIRHVFSSGWLLKVSRGHPRNSLSAQDDLVSAGSGDLDWVQLESQCLAISISLRFVSLLRRLCDAL